MKGDVVRRSCPKDNVATVNQLTQLQLGAGQIEVRDVRRAQVMKAIKNGAGLTLENRYEGRRKYVDVKSEN